MLAAIVNAVMVALGGLIGLVGKRFVSEKVGNTVSQGLALCVLYIGISGSFDCQNVLVVITSIVIGAIIGETVDLDYRLNTFSEGIEKKMSKPGKKVDFALGFVTSTLLFCIGAMAIVGSLNAGLRHDYSIIFAKTAIDFTTAIIYASTMGIGVSFSAIPILLYQGGITLLAGVLQPLLTEVVIAEMSATGSLIIIGLGLNMLGLTKIKVANFLPAVFVPMLLYPLIALF